MKIAVVIIFRLTRLPDLGILDSLIILATSVSVAPNRPAQDSQYDEVVDPDDALLVATAASPLSQLDEWPDWETWEAPAKIVNSAPCYKTGYDHDKVPVFVMEFGKWDYRGLADLPQDELDDFHKYYHQFVRRVSREAAANNDQGVVFICDWDGFALRNYASSKALKLALTSFTTIVQFNSALKYAFYINVNFAAESFINLANPFFGSLLEKFEIYGTHSEQWKPALLRKIPQDQLPPKYGGSGEWKPVPVT